MGHQPIHSVPKFAITYLQPSLLLDNVLFRFSCIQGSCGSVNTSLAGSTFLDGSGTSYTTSPRPCTSAGATGIMQRLPRPSHPGMHLQLQVRRGMQRLLQPQAAGLRQLQCEG
jgi:hypothetical protein